MSFSSFVKPSRWLKAGSRFSFLLALTAAILVSVILPAAADAAIPTFTIIKVVKDATVTIQTSNFPADETFTVLMGPIGTKGINGIEVATTKTGTGGTIEATYDIPEKLKGIELISIRLESASGYFSYNWFYNGDPAPAAQSTAAATTAPIDTEVKYSGIPTFSIKEVAAGKSVTIITDNFPADQEFTVLMGQYGTKAVKGIEVAKTKSEKGGAIEVTYQIPADLAKDARIAIRADSADGTYYSYNWFYNADWPVKETAVTPAATETAPAAGTEEISVYNGVPIFSIVKVTPGNSVTISTGNLPADVTFTVLMGAYGTKGIDGKEAGTLESGKGEPQEKTFSIPADLAKEDVIAIRLVSESDYYAYNWFYNTLYPVAETEYTGVPTFTISKVVKGKTVSVLTDNFPPDLAFTVYMGKYGTYAIDGKEIDKVEAGKGGALELTFDIPTDFAESNAVAIRMVSADGTYNAYNWFFNN